MIQVSDHLEIILMMECFHIQSILHKKLTQRNNYQKLVARKKNPLGL
jgi:hypothetical protein